MRISTSKIVKSGPAEPKDLNPSQRPKSLNAVVIGLGPVGSEAAGIVVKTPSKNGCAHKLNRDAPK